MENPVGNVEKVHITKFRIFICSVTEQDIPKYLDKRPFSWYNADSILESCKRLQKPRSADAFGKEGGVTYQEEQGPRAGGAPLTPRSEREAVLIYRSVLDTVRDAETPEEGNRILRDLLEVSFGEKQLQDVPNPNRMIIRPMLVSLDKAAERHDRSVDAGGSGGRPRLELDREIYGLPAGLIDPGESAAEAAIRELKEETGLDMIRFRHVLPASYSAVGLSNEQCICVFGIAGGTIAPSKETGEEITARWYTRDELRELVQTKTFGSWAQAYTYMWTLGF